MSIDSAILETPEETHEPSKDIPFRYKDVTKGNTPHYRDNGKIDEDSKLATNFINEESDEECSQNFPDSE